MLLVYICLRDVGHVLRDVGHIASRRYEGRAKSSITNRLT